MKQYNVRLHSTDDPEWFRLVCDGIDDTVSIQQIFSQQIEDDMIVHSIRCYLAIENKTLPNAQSVIEGIAKRGGIQTPARPVYLQRVQYDAERDIYLVTYGLAPSDDSYGIEVRPAQLTDWRNSAILFAWQIGSFLRFQGFSTLTPEAIAAVEARTFWGA